MIRHETRVVAVRRTALRGLEYDDPITLRHDAPLAEVLAAAPADDDWFALDVVTVQEKRWTDGGDGVKWLQVDDVPVTRYFVSVGERLDDLVAMTRSGLPLAVGENDVVLSPEQLTAARRGGATPARLAVVPDTAR